ncbi:MAG: DHH family phosphoesterase, partial [Candidatus Wallbacteria bacterium]|nr:DHH family phosphoesterase [Candidatus Wallbacteria bacterium]
MKTLIASHPHADFDALASMVAASKLFPDSELYLPNTASIKVRQFLNLHLKHYNWYAPDSKNPRKFERLIMVDTRRLEGIQFFLSDNAEILVLDHHLENGLGGLEKDGFRF